MLMAFISGFALVVVSFGIVYAYTEEKWFTYSPTHKYDTSWPSSPTSWVSRVGDARTAWNNVSPTTFNWSYSSSAIGKVEYILLCCSRLGETGFHWYGLPYLSDITAAFPRINIQYNWYTGTGTPPATYFDLQSVLTHEFGHASGLIEHSTSGSCSGTSGPTMCPSISAVSTHWRTLEQEDKDRLNAVYP